MKKYVSILLALLVGLLALAGCGQTAEKEQKDPESGKLKIVTTIFPEYDWVREIVGDQIDQVELTMLLDNGVDLHSYQPTADDMVKIASCDVFVFVGGESDEWVQDALKTTVNQNMILINLLDVLGDSVKEEETVDGMETEDEEEEEPEADEHVWLSLKNAQVICGYIAEQLAVADAQNAAVYTENSKAYCEKLKALDEQYRAVTDAAVQKNLLFADRFPFRYLTDDYGLTYYAAFSGCSAETEASFETIKFLSDKVDELGLRVVMTTESANQKIAQTIIAGTQTKDQDILSLNSMQGTTATDVKNGQTYLLLMQENLNVLQQALV